jgi:hypothetical protein
MQSKKIKSQQPMKQGIKPIIIFYPFGKGMMACFFDAFFKGLAWCLYLQRT